MVDLEKFITKLRTVDFDEEDMADARREDINIEDIAEEVERIIEIVPQQPTKISSRKESREMVRETMAKLGSLRKAYDASYDHFRDAELTRDGESLCILFSDWHFGKVVKKPGGEIIFDSKIAFDRVVNDFIPQIINIIKDVNRVDRIEDIRIFFVGDIVDNDIVYSTQRLHIDKPVASQFHDVTRAIMMFIAGIRAAFADMGKVDIPIKMESVPGNHGRGSEFSDDAGCSWDTAIMSAVELAVIYSEIPNVEVKFSLDKYLMVDVRGHKGLLRHGAPPQAETSAGKAKFGGWNDLFDFDFLCYGHVHHWGINTYNGKPLFRNGALCGTDDYAIELAVGDNWGQLVWGISDKDVPTFINRLH